MRTARDLTPNQYVAHRLTWARIIYGWTQQEVADRLGGSWTRVKVSAAERSVTGARVRRFDAEDLTAFSRVFGLPVSFFFPPELGGDWHDRVEELRQERIAELERPFDELGVEPMREREEEDR
jgi:transcriptional regulator with XRE-family HTH domain